MKSCLYCVHFRFSTMGTVAATCSVGSIPASNRFKKLLDNSHIDETDLRLALSESEDCDTRYPTDDNHIEEL